MRLNSSSMVSVGCIEYYPMYGMVYGMVYGVVYGVVYYGVSMSSAF